MTEEVHKITITVDNLLVNMRSNGDGFEYSKVKELLCEFVKNALQMSSDALIPCHKATIDLKDERIA